MVDSRKSRDFSPRDRANVTVTALTQRLEDLANHSDKSVVAAARATVECIQCAEPLDVRSFHNLYFRILQQGKTLSSDHQHHEWRTVRDTAVGIYHALLREFRDDVKARAVRRLQHQAAVVDDQQHELAQA